MDEKIIQLQKQLTEEGHPEFVSFLPNSLSNAKFTDGFKDLNKLTISEIARDNDLLPHIADFTNIAEAQDIKKISELLSQYPPIKGDFFEKESTRNKTIKEDNVLEGFSTPSYKRPNTSSNSGTVSNSNDSQAKISKDCNVDDYIIERISKEILETNLNIKWDDIVGLEDIKKAINEIVLWPMMRPDIFTGLRGPPKGLLLFGPPGTGKTMIGKCIASQCKATFFSISASSLTSKWVGEGEKMVRALFYLGRKMSPSVIFIDEIDSLLSQRSDNENEGSRRIKTEFLVQFDGASVNDNDRILVIGATNRPQEIDEAARRRLVKRIYVALPDFESRKTMIRQLMNSYLHCLNDSDLDSIAELTDGYSGSDIFNLCREASMEPLREIKDICTFNPSDTRAISIDDFRKATNQIRKSVSSKDLEGYSVWNEQFGSIRNQIIS